MDGFNVVDDKSFLLSFPVEFVEEVDNQAKLLYSTRTQYIKDAVVMRLRFDLARSGTSPSFKDLQRKQLIKYLQSNEA